MYFKVLQRTQRTKKISSPLNLLHCIFGWLKILLEDYIFSMIFFQSIDHLKAVLQVVCTVYGVQYCNLSILKLN